jgi:putative transposase
MADFGLSERQACKLLGLDRTSYRYTPRPDRNAELRGQLIALAKQKPRYGYRRLLALLERRGWHVNHKRLYRLYRQEHLAVRRLKRKRLARPSVPIAHLERANQEWSMDFVMDGLARVARCVCSRLWTVIRVSAWRSKSIAACRAAA